MQLRMSPGGSIFMSSRSRPEEPPSSVTVTTAESSRMMHRRSGQGGAGATGISGCRPIRIPLLRSGVTTYRFSPRSKVDNPVPPPMATTRSSFSFGSAELCSDMREVSYPSLDAKGLGLDLERLDLRIEQLREARVVRH